MITQLKNPRTQNYLRLKKVVLSDSIPWTYVATTCEDVSTNPTVWGIDNSSFFGSALLLRSNHERPYPLQVANQELLNLTSKVVIDIVRFNKLKFNCILRANFNLTIPHDEKDSWSPKHIDHPYPHQNLLIYFKTCTDGGEFRVWENQYEYGDTEEPKWGNYETFKPSEDSVITFNGLNYHQGQSPTSLGQTRVALVVTYM